MGVWSSSSFYALKVCTMARRASAVDSPAKIASSSGHMSITSMASIKGSLGVPPGHIGGIAKGAAHDGSSSFCRSAAGSVRMGTRCPKRGTMVCCSQMEEIVVFWMHKNRHTSGQQFRARCGNGQRCAIFQMEGEVIESALPL
ncbi:MAG: hypothetical protein R3E31_02070 [Chloroflexota bacterium]